MTVSDAMAKLASGGSTRAKRRRRPEEAGTTPPGRRSSRRPGEAGESDREEPAGGEVERVLLVDDRKDNLIALEAVLQPLGFDLLKATSGTEALRILLDEDVAVVVLDVQMPGMDGFETASLLKSRSATRSIPILFLTAVGHSVEHELRGYEVGAVDYICKPFEPKVLRAKVRAIVDLSNELRALSRSARVYEESGAALSSIHSTSGIDLGASGDAGDAVPPLLFAPPLSDLVRSEQEHLSDTPVPPAFGAPDVLGVDPLGKVGALGEVADSEPFLDSEAAADCAGGGAVAGGGGGGRRRFVNLRRLVDLEVAADLEAPAKARAAVRGALADRGDDLEDIVLLLVSELVTNAVLHARSTAMVRLDLGERAVRVEIEDRGVRLPTLAVPALTDESGRGLLMVEQLAARYGWTQLDGGKSVWFELDLPAETAGADR